MKEVIAVIRPEKRQATPDAARALGLTDCTQMRVNCLAPTGICRLPAGLVVSLGRSRPLTKTETKTTRPASGHWSRAPVPGLRRQTG